MIGGNSKDNPYRPPKSNLDVPTSPQGGRREEGLARPYLFVLTTLFGGFIANLAANICLAISYTGQFQLPDMALVTNPVGAGFVIIGFFVGAWVASRIAE